MDFKDILGKFNSKPENNRIAGIENSAEPIKPHEKRKTFTVAIVNQKGGCGKTTTAVNLSACLAEKGYKTLLVDLDAQAHASLGIGVDVAALKSSVCDVFKNSSDMTKVILPTSIANLDVVPATPLLSGIQLEIADVLGREGILRIAIKKMLEKMAEPYHYIIIDCSPTLNIITINALTSARYVLVPIQTHYYSLEGMKELLSTIDVVKDRLNPDLDILGILVTLFDKRPKINREMLSQIKEYFNTLLFDTMVNINVKLCEAPIYKKPITAYDPSCRGAEDYLKVAHEFLMRTDETYKLLNEPVDVPTAVQVVDNQTTVQADITYMEGKISG